MNHLLRSIAPVSERAWEMLDQEAREHLVPALGARKLVDFAGPFGFDYSSTNLGRVKKLAAAPCEGVEARQRRVLPLVELRSDFKVLREELVDFERGAVDADLDDLDEAVQRIAIAENSAVFNGFEAAGIVGIAQATTHPPIPLGDATSSFPSQVAKAVELIRREGIGGPYGLALAPAEYTRVVETTEHGGYPVFEHLRRILGGPIVWTPGIDGAVVVSLRGGDFLFESGEDLALGYDRTHENHLHLYVEETFSFRVATPEAAVALP
ncbi:MAG TPA: family 1 encapsulin nanocompartment shell protein [Gaiellales bacterium]